MRFGSKERGAAEAASPVGVVEDDHAGTDEDTWRTFAEVALERLALLHRIARASAPSADEGAATGADLGTGTGAVGIEAVLTHLESTGGMRREASSMESARRRLDPLLEQARSRFRAMLDQPVAFATIAENADLSLPEAELLAVCAACELDLRLARLVAYVQDENGPSRVNLQTADRLLRDAGSGVAAAVGLDSGLRRSEFVEVTEDGPWALHTIIVQPGVMWALVGDTAVDPGLPLGTVVANGPADDRVIGETQAFVVVSGDDRLRRREAAVTRTAAERFLVSTQPTDLRGWQALVREATLSGSGIVIELEDEIGATLTPDGRRTIARATHLAWAVTARRELPLQEMPARPWVEITADSHAATPDEWVVAVGEHEHGHRLSPTQLDLVGLAYRARPGDLDGAVRRLVSGKLEQLAQRMRPSRTWDDIVLTPARSQQLHSIVDRYRFANRVYDEWGFVPQPSRGLVSLFSGPSGTGKTLAAEIIAGDLGLDVFKLDLSSVVSKYIGETEKNLEQIFEAAGGSNVVLFFDEADSLFGKRSEVKDARDRYANIEVSYLLQRLERYDGVVVLATNFEKNIDEAFLRRIHTRVEFVVPAVDERITIWARNIPAGAPVGDLDLAFLAKQFELSGGSIRNAAVHSAFLAAAKGTPITMELAVTAIAREYRKLGRLLKPEHFGQWFAVATSVD